MDDKIDDNQELTDVVKKIVNDLSSLRHVEGLIEQLTKTQKELFKNIQQCEYSGKFIESSEILQQANIKMTLLSGVIKNLQSHVDKVEKDRSDFVTVGLKLDCGVEISNARNCTQCRYSDSYGLPDKTGCLSCTATEDGRGSGFQPLNEP